MSESAGFDIPVFWQNTGERFVWLCERCGQPHKPGPLCNSGIHVGPGEEANGEAIKSVDLAEKLRERDAYSEADRERWNDLIWKLSKLVKEEYEGEDSEELLAAIRERLDLLALENAELRGKAV